MRPNRKLLFAIVAGIALLLALGAVWALVLPRSQPAPAPEPPPPAPQPEAGPALPPEDRIVRVQCRQSACFWMRVGGIEPVASRPDGELRRLTYRSGSSFDDPAVASAPDIEWEAQPSTSYAYCSTDRPAYAFPTADGEGSSDLTAHHLDLFDVPGYQHASARIYGLICHGLAIEAETEPDWRSLGYRPGTRSGQSEIEAPEALLTAPR